MPLGDAIRCVQFSADWNKLAVVSDEGVRVYNFEHILKTWRIPESKIGFIEEPDVISAIFLGTTGEGIITANLTNQVLLWRQTAKEKTGPVLKFTGATTQSVTPNRILRVNDLS